jgi:hypothetical protein
VSHVFTYGSLMFERVWSRVVRGTYPAASATLSGFRRQRVLGQDDVELQDPGIPAGMRAGSAVGAGSRIEGPGEDALAGIVYLGVQAEDLAALDAFEGSEYRRIQVQVTVLAQVAGGPVPGSLLPADTYLFIASDKVAPGPWDPDDFERERIERFLRDYPPPRPA